MAAKSSFAWPDLAPSGWRDTFDTLHMWTQIVGKTRLALAPMENHWWQVALYVTVHGLTTSPMPHGSRAVAVEFDFISHELIVRADDGAGHSFPLRAMTVADFFAQYLGALRNLGIDPAIYASPVEVETAIPFARDSKHASYDAEAAHRCWQILLNTHRVMKRFRGGFTGKQSPVHFFWGSFDLAVTRFSGRPAPPRPGADLITREAYSHEVISAGFWPGNGGFGTAAFYCYAAPEPPGLGAEGISPQSALYSTELKEFILKYDDVRRSNSPDDAVMEFLESSYQAGAKLAHWDRAVLERPAYDTSRK